MDQSQKVRLHFFTGKGGVGKTTLSYAYANFLHEQNLKVIHLTLSSPNISKVIAITKNQVSPKFETSVLNVKDAVYEYVRSKIHSDIVASWIVKTTFFKSLINMIPSFGYLIFLGKVFELIVEDPYLHVVVDAPASGHFKTLIQSPEQFSAIFQNGIIFNDTVKMLNFLNNPNNLKIWITTLPNELSVNESLELKNDLLEKNKLSSQIILNQSLMKLNLHQTQFSSQYLSGLIKDEKRAIERLHSSAVLNFLTIPFLFEDSLYLKLSEYFHES